MRRHLLLPILCVTAFCVSAFADGELDIDDGSDIDDELLLQMDMEEEYEIDDEEQKDFVIIDSDHEYNMNPHTAAYNSDAQLLSSLYEGLFSYDPATLEASPALAEKHRVSRNRLRWTFTIREGALFSDGTPITASCVRESWLNLIAEKGMYASLLDCIKGAKAYRTGEGTSEDVGIIANDERVLVVVLTTPAGYLPRVLCHCAFVVCNKEGAYSGAFCLERISEEEHTLYLVRNEKYWDVKNVKLQRVTIRQSSDAEANCAAFNSGEAQWIAGPADVGKIYNKQAVQLSAQFATEYLFFKCRDEENSEAGTQTQAAHAVWNNADMRAALLAAVPWEALREKCFVKATTLVYPLAGYPATEGYSDSDMDEAASLLDEARAAHGITDEKLQVVLAITDTDYMKDMAQLLIDAWEKLGVEVLVQKTPPERYLEAIPAWDADIFTYTWIGDFADPLAFLELFEGESTLNVSLWQDDAFDGYIAEAARYSDDERFRLLSKAEQVLLDSAVVLPISHPVSLNVINNSEVGGWRANAFDIHPFKSLYRKTSTVQVPGLVMLRK